MKAKKSWWIVPAVITLSTYLLLRFVLLIGYVPTSSMEPTLQEGSYILGIRHYRELNEGDVIIFRHEGQLLVKRIAGCPGDKIDLRNLTYMASRPIPVWEEPVLVIPEDSYFVLGDNVQNSIDSRYWEDPFVQQTNIVAKLIWPNGGA